MNPHRLYNRESVSCPYCGYEPDETYPEPNGNCEVEECGKCEMKYYMSASVSYEMEKNCTLNWHEHIWIKDPIMAAAADKDWFECKNCCESKVTKKALTDIEELK